MDFRTLGYPVHHQLLKLAQTHVHRVSGAMQPSHYSLLPPSIFPSIRVFSNESILRIRWPKYWSLSFSISVPPMDMQDCFPLGLIGLVSLQSKGLSRVFSSTIVQKHQFFGTQLSLWSNSHIHTSLLGKTTALIRWTFICKVMSLLFNKLAQFSSVQFTRSVVSDSLRPHESQHARPPCP